MTTEHPEPDIDPLDALAEEFTARCRRGETPTIAEYTERYPNLADRIRRLFEPVVMIEELGAIDNQERVLSQSRAAFKSQIPKQLGDFEIVDEVGRGGMGIVYEAVQKSLRRRVAVKLLARQALVNDKHLQRFQREARTAARLHHSNIVPVLGVGDQDGYHYYVMQFIDGVGLDEILAQLRPSGNATGPTTQNRARHTAVANVITYLQGPSRRESSAAEPREPETSETNAAASPLPPHNPTTLGAKYWQSIALIGAKVADALNYAHDQNVLHRDIKPGNLLLGEGGEVWVADFGLAKAFTHDDVSQTGDIVGTLRYMSPEQLTGEEDHRSDIYSLGLTLYESLTLNPAHGDTRRFQPSKQTQHAPFARPRAVSPDIPADLETIVLKACETEPADRYQTAGELAADLNRFLKDEPIHARRATYAERLWRWCRRNPVVAGLSFATSLLLLLVTISTTVGYIHTNAALTREARQRKRAEGEKQKAERILGISLEALERVYVRFAPDRLSGPMQLTVQQNGAEFNMPSQPVLSKETAELLEHVLKFYDRFAHEDINNRVLQAEAAKATRRVGDIQQRLGEHSRAERSYKLAITQYEQLADDIEYEAKATLEIARINNALGTVYRSSHRSDAAEEAHNTALKILSTFSGSKLFEHNLRFELAYTHYLLARRVAPAPGGPPDQRPRIPPYEVDSSLNCAIELLTSGDTESSAHPAHHQRLLAICYRERSRGATSEDRVAAVRILQQLTSEYPDIAENRYELSIALSPVDVERFHSEPDLVELEARLREAHQHGVILARRHPNIPDYSHTLARTNQDLGVTLRRLASYAKDGIRQSLLEESNTLCREAIRLQTELVNRFPKAASYRLWQAKFQEALAKTLRDQNRLVAARKIMETSLEDLEAIPRHDTTDWFVDHAIRIHHRTLRQIINRTRPL